MRLKNLILAAVPALMLASCSSDDSVSENPQNPALRGNGYLGVSINLPTQNSGTRAANDNFDDGTENEYEVKDGAVLLFKGEDQKTATFFGAYTLNNTPVEDQDNDNITTSFLDVIEVENLNLDETDNLYALVVLNYTELFTVSGTELTIKGDGVFSGNFSNLLEKTSSKDFYNKTNTNYFFMTNSPIVDKPGGATAPTGYELTYLTKLNGTLYPTEEEARKSPAGSVYVERAVAKATLSVSPASLVLQDNDGNETTLSITDTDWAISNAEGTSYIVRNLGDLTGDNDYLPWTSALKSNYRFVGHTKIGTTSIQPERDLYRTYWCVDPAYDKDKTYRECADADFKDKETPLYCYENTFDVAHQNYKNTTRAVLKVTYGGGTFCTIDGAEYAGKTFTEDVAKTYPTKYIMEDYQLKKAFQEALRPEQTVNIAEYVTVTFARDANDGILKVTDITVNVPEGMISDTDETKPFTKAPAFGTKNTLINNVNEFFVINEYVDGVSYYDVRFMHFAGTSDASDLAPWTAPEVNTPTTAEAYGTDLQSSKNYLGRYGMVRNNWYDISVTDIKRLGSPVIPSADVETPDDNKEINKYISFKVNILSWAKRTQSVVL